MTTQEQKQLKIDWLWLLLQPLLVKAIHLFGDTFFDWLLEKMKGDDDLQEVFKSPTCTPPKEYNPITKTCQDPIGKVSG